MDTHSELPEDSPEDLQEPTPTSTPLEIVEDSDKPQEKPVESKKGKTKPEETKIRIPGAAALLMLGIFATLGAGTYHILKPTPPPVVVQEQPTEKPKKKSQFFPDEGLFKKTGKTDYKTILQRRIQQASKQIFVITDNPSEPALLSALMKKKQETGLPIYIITDKVTQPEKNQTAKNAGFPIYITQNTLERPYTILLIDQGLVVDISRNNWIWETLEEESVNRIKKWTAELSGNSTILQ